MDNLLEIFFRKASAELADLSERIRSCPGTPGPRVTGSGDAIADILVLKLSPDANERVAGHAFAGKSGDVVLKSALKLEIHRSALFGTNLMKCDKAGPACDDRCRAFLAEELGIVEPRLVLAMGERAFVAAADILGHHAEYMPGATARRAARATVIGTVDFESAMADEGSKKQLWRDLKLLGAEYRGG